MQSLNFTADAEMFSAQLCTEVMIKGTLYSKRCVLSLLTR